jgi:ABC-type Fe3+/spermidine/putrescine transport system ATPase subunit
LSALELIEIRKSFGRLAAVAGVSFEVAPAEIVAVLGPSGCGKSTLLGLVAGLEQPDSGQICWNGASLAQVPPHQRGFGLMFQDFALFPHRNVYRNVAFGLEMQHAAEAQIRKRVREVLELVGLPGFESRDVNTLSGGESQRVALARSLAPRPNLLMLDEPLGALDRSLRERLVFDLRQILHLSGQTALYVTHDQEEAFSIADRVMIMNAGKIEQIGHPQALYCEPSSLFVARFLNLGNVFTGEIRPGPAASELTTPFGTYNIETEKTGTVQVLLRPDAVSLAPGGVTQINGEVIESTFRGLTCRLIVAVQDARLVFEFPSQASLPAAGEAISLSFDPQQALLILPG